MVRHCCARHKADDQVESSSPLRAVRRDRHAASRRRPAASSGGHSERVCEPAKHIRPADTLEGAASSAPKS